MGLYSRDINIGKPNLDKNVSVKNLNEVVSAVKDLRDDLAETTEELKKISLGTSLISGDEVESSE